MHSLFKYLLIGSFRTYDIEYLFDKSISFCNIKWLDLSCNRIDDEGFRYLCSNFKFITKTEKIYLEYNKIGDLGITYFCDNCIYLSNLKILSLPSITYLFYYEI